MGQMERIEERVLHERIASTRQFAVVVRIPRVRGVRDAVVEDVGKDARGEEWGGVRVSAAWLGVRDWCCGHCGILLPGLD